VPTEREEGEDLATTALAIAINLISAALGALLVVAYRQLRERNRRRGFSRAMSEFFGPFEHKFTIVHSAIFDAEDRAFNYPATDTRAARALTKLFESLGLREGVDFNVCPDRQAEKQPDLWDRNLVLLCGPARNNILRATLPRLEMRYRMDVAPDTRRNILTDTVANVQLKSSRELAPETESTSGYDFGLVASAPSSHNAARRIVVLAGIHGTGTVGAAEFVCAVDSLELLNARRSREVVSQALRVNYEADIETPTQITLI
jgi:hypothetical protein